MRILVDADACPVKKQIVQLAKQHQSEVIMVLDSSHLFDDGYSQVIMVDKGRDSADLRLANLLVRGDLVVTQDFGVAAMALGKGARALNQNGMEYTAENIDQLLFERHLGQKTRRSGGRTRGPGKRTVAEDQAFVRALERILAGQ